jgi:hypothetical protein
VQPKYCVCDRHVYIEGEQFGPFIIKKFISKEELQVQCLLCGSFHKMKYNNVKKQHSCGCKPRHIVILEIDENKFIYTCKKCGRNTITNPPVVIYCCEEEG